MLEVVWAIALKNADGFTRLWPSVLGLSAAWISFGPLALSLRTLPVGIAYAAWTGIGVVGVAAVGILAEGEGSSLIRMAFLAVILGGVIGLKFSDADSGSARPNASTTTRWQRLPPRTMSWSTAPRRCTGCK